MTVSEKDNVLPFQRPPERPDGDCRMVDEQGVEWFLFAVDFTHDDKNWACEIWATDFADAEAKVASLRVTATLGGQVFGRVPA